MNYLIISCFIYFLIIGLLSLGNIFHYYFYKIEGTKKLISGFAIFGISYNFLFFVLKIENIFIFLFYLIILILAFILSVIKTKDQFFIEIKNTLLITVIPFIFFTFFAAVYGEQYYVFRGNYWDYFNYLSAASVYSKHGFVDILDLFNQANLPHLYKTAHESQIGRPLVMSLLSFFYNLKYLNIFFLSYFFKIFLILLGSVAYFNLIKKLFLLNKTNEFLVLTVVYTFSFWNFYLIEIDALSQLAAFPIYLILLSEMKVFFIEIKKKNFYFLIFFVILLSCFFLLYPELFLVYLLLLLIYGICLNEIKFSFFIKNYLSILFLIFFFLIFTTVNYSSTYLFLLDQINTGIYRNNTWWGYFGAFIIGRENPILDENFVTMFKLNLEHLKNFKSILIYINEEMQSIKYYYYLFNIIPSFFGFYYLTDIKFLSDFYYINLPFLLLFSIFLIKISFKNILVIFKFNNDLKILIKSFFILFISLFILLISNSQFWSIIKLFSYFSIFFFLFTISKVKKEKNHIKFRLNYTVLILVIIFPLYKFSDFNNGILRYDSFPSIMNVSSKTAVNWHFEKKTFKDCKYIKLNFNQNKLNDFKMLYLSMNLTYNDFVFIEKNTLINSNNNVKRSCNINDNYFD